MLSRTFLFINKCSTRVKLQSRNLVFHKKIFFNNQNNFVFSRTFCQGTPDNDTKEKNKLLKKDLDTSSQKRNFITPLRATNEYLLRPSDLEGLRKIERRSPFYNGPPITVHLRSDVEKKALEVWGNLEALQNEQRMKNKHKIEDAEDVEIERFLEDYSRPMREKKSKNEDSEKNMALQGTERVVKTAIVINGLNFAFKTTAWIYTGSHSMFAEAVHSFADTLNQIILAFGIKMSSQQANFAHPYGFHNLRYVSSLISGVGIFFMGTGLSFYHGITGLIYEHTIDHLFWAYIVLTGSLLSEGGTLIVAFNEVRKAAKRDKLTIPQYVLSSQDPSINVVLLEDFAAVVGVGIAGSCMALTSIYANSVFDSVGSILVGSLLGCVATFVVYSNSNALVGKSIPVNRIMKISRDLENDHMVRALHDVKATDMGSLFVRYKAEIDFDGRELTRAYLSNQSLVKLLEEVQKIKTDSDVESFILKHGENIVDLLGAEIDRIEKDIKKKYPEVRHVDLEVL